MMFDFDITGTSPMFIDLHRKHRKYLSFASKLQIQKRKESSVTFFTNKGGYRRPEKSRKWEALFSVHVLLCVHLMLSG